MGQPVMFNIEPTPVSKARVAARASGPERQAREIGPTLDLVQRDSMRDTAPMWRAYTGPRTACQLGTYLKHYGKPGGHIADAKYRRTFKDVTVHLCTDCSMTQRSADGVGGSLPSRSARRK